MKTYRLDKMTRGWFIGDFDPSVLKTKDFEVGVLVHKKGEIWEPHFHKEVTEYNVLITGWMKIQGKTLVTGDIFVLEKDEIADPEFIRDCTILVVKVPSIPGDKYIV